MTGIYYKPDMMMARPSVRDCVVSLLVLIVLTTGKINLSLSPLLPLIDY